jgi:hypothetical protein
MTLYAFNNEMPLGTHATANFVRGEVRRKAIRVMHPPCMLMIYLGFAHEVFL